MSRSITIRKFYTDDEIVKIDKDDMFRHDEPIELVAPKEFKEAKEDMKNEDVAKLFKALENCRITGKSTWIKDGKIYELDHNFNPPRVREIKEGE